MAKWFQKYATATAISLLMPFPAAAARLAQGLAPAPADTTSPAPRPEPAYHDDAQPRRGQVTVGGKVIRYTVTPGTLIIRDRNDQPVASIFYVAYVADRPPGQGDRPVTFLFNGGPGSASMFLHLGSIAPVRIDFPSGTTGLPTPAPLKENPYSLIDHSDLVFIDALGTGFSRTIGKARDQDYWSVDKDADLFAKAIGRYLTINDRWSSPKYLFGESYGTTRATALAYRLSTPAGGGIKLNGLILLGTNLNHGIYLPELDTVYVEWLPSFAAAAWYHHTLAQRSDTLEPFLTRVREWALGPYAEVLAKGSNATDAEKLEIARQYSAYTGLPVRTVLDADLRISQSDFRKALLRDRGLTIGRNDSRFTGSDAQGAVDGPEYDPNVAFNGAQFGPSINKYLFGTLRYETNLAYRSNIYDQIKGQWDRGHVGPDGQTMALANTSIDLARTMRENRALKVLFLNGYYDMATPFMKTEYDVSHMRIDKELRTNITFRYYESGHMAYTNSDEMPKIKADLDAFYQ